MRVTSITLTNFRCFGPEPQTLSLRDVTALVGSNGCGKSAALQALNRLFGMSQADRTLHRADFHLPAGKDWDEVEEATLRIEAIIEFPELSNGDFDDAAAACFKHMTVPGEAETPFCRIRLDGTWEKSNLPEGDVEQKLYWVTSAIDADEDEEKTQPVQNHERSRIHVHYVPASRDPGRQIRQVAGSMLHTLLRAVHWSDDARERITEASDTIREAFENESGVEAIEDAINACWRELHTAPEHRQVNIRPVASRLEDLLKQVDATFSPGPADREDGLDRLSDGQKSLFYLALVGAMFDVQAAVGEFEDKAISRAALNPPVLNVLAVEEPENHVAPHYLGRIVKLLRRIGESDRGQVVLTSHSASILSRIEPEEVRHLRTKQPERTTLVREIQLPEDESEQHKFVREAVRAYPELYFAKFVVLGEGDSEEIVIPRLADAMGVPVDASLVSVVPLGGRHVNHLWRLLNQLEIPHVTLLDLDRERRGGGWGRIKYAVEQLLAIGVSPKTLLAVERGGKSSVLSSEEVEEMHEWDVSDKETMRSWIERLEERGVYFSKPLDLDFMMLRKFPNAYETVVSDGKGPDIPDDPDEYQREVRKVVRSVLKESSTGAETYTKDEVNAFFWYRYLFLGRGKPSTHILALSQITDGELRDSAPRVLVRLIKAVQAALANGDAEGADED